MEKIAQTGKDPIPAWKHGTVFPVEMERTSMPPKMEERAGSHETLGRCALGIHLGPTSRSAKGFCQGDRDRVSSGHLFLPPSDKPRFLAEKKVVGQERCTGVLAKPIPD